MKKPPLDAVAIVDVPLGGGTPCLELVYQFGLNHEEAVGLDSLLREVTFEEACVVAKHFGDTMLALVGISRSGDEITYGLAPLSIEDFPSAVRVVAEWEAYNFGRCVL